MQKILIDSAILGIPNYAGDSAEAEQLLTRVINLASICHPSLPIETLICASDENTIWENGLGPEYSQISEFMDLLGLSEVFSPADLTTAYHSIFQFSARVDRHPSTIAPEELKTEPQIPSHLCPALLLSLSKASVLDAAYKRLDGQEYVLFSALLCDEVRSILTYLPGDSENSHLQITVPLIYRFADMVTSNTAHQIWSSMTSPQEAVLAILIEAQSLRKESGSEVLVDPRSVTVGGAFQQSLHQNEAAAGGRYSGATLSLCAQIVAGTCSREVKPFGRPSQKVREAGDLAYRVHITKGGIGLRLLLWIDGQRIEFANVGPKFELQIADASPSYMLSVDWHSLLN